jgi:hypothetical protein
MKSLEQGICARRNGLTKAKAAVRMNLFIRVINFDAVKIGIAT